MAASSRLACKGRASKVTINTVRGTFAGMCQCLNRGSYRNAWDFQVHKDQLHFHTTEKVRLEQVGMQGMDIECHNTHTKRDLCGDVPVPKQRFLPKSL